jgi:uncharacterized membrane protein YkvA (DUF1232 family)
MEKLSAWTSLLRPMVEAMKANSTTREDRSRPSRWNRLKKSLLALKAQVHALWLASKDKRTPWYAKTLAGLVVAYALSPIGLIPDFIPVLGYLDDLLILPAGIALAIKLIPPEVMAEARLKAGINPASAAPAD